MLQIEFLKPLDAKEIYDPAVESLKRFAAERDLPMQVYNLNQQVYEVTPRQHARHRRRIGIHGHLEYSFGYGGKQELLGRIMLLSDLQYGGFPRGVDQTYGSIYLAKPSEIPREGLMDPSDELLKDVHGLLSQTFAVVH